MIDFYTRFCQKTHIIFFKRPEFLAQQQIGFQVSTCFGTPNRSLLPAFFLPLEKHYEVFRTSDVRLLTEFITGVSADYQSTQRVVQGENTRLGTDTNFGSWMLKGPFFSTKM